MGVKKMRRSTRLNIKALYTTKTQTGSSLHIKMYKCATPSRWRKQRLLEVSMHKSESPSVAIFLMGEMEASGHIFRMTLAGNL